LADKYWSGANTHLIDPDHPVYL